MAYSTRYFTGRYTTFKFSELSAWREELVWNYVYLNFVDVQQLVMMEAYGKKAWKSTAWLGLKITENF